MKNSIPDQMRAVELSEQREDFAEALRNLRVVSKPVPRPGKGQVLVKMEAASCNPSDMLFLRGLYKAPRTFPSVPGFEGAGTVVASGGGLLGKALVGRRVACGGQRDADGTWAEYFIAEAQLCIPLSGKLSFDQGASMIVNPMSALALFDMARGKHKAAVVNAAAGQLGRMLINLAAEAGYPLLCIVRRKDEVAMLERVGATKVLSSDQPDFAAKLKAECHGLGATIGFDAVGGPATAQLIDAMPPDSVVVMYGLLSDTKCDGIDPGKIVFDNKRIENFWLTTWLQKAPLLQRFLASNRAQKLIAAGGFNTAIRRRVKLDDVADALAEYNAEMGKGRILVAPSLR